MSELSDKLSAHATRLEKVVNEAVSSVISGSLDKVNDAAKQVGRAWSGSWIGYQSRVYYADFAPPPPGAHFSSEWGFQDTYTQESTGDLPWDEFNHVPVAGFTNIARLSEMLDEAAIAFIVMTAEDEQVDGKMHARLNVIHEAGLFQGKLGFTKAIVLREDGCEEFSNIQGLGQIPFPKGNIKAVFEEIRRVLEREGLIETVG